MAEKIMSWLLDVRLRISRKPLRVHDAAHVFDEPRNSTEARTKHAARHDAVMEWLYFAVIAPLAPLMAVVGAWLFTRPAAPARGVGGLSCDGARSHGM